MHASDVRKTVPSCEDCTLKETGLLCHLSHEAASEFESIKLSSSYPSGSILFFEGEASRGVFLVCSGKVKVSVSSRGGKTLILQIARPGEMLGLSAAMSGVPYEVSAETLYPSQLAFIRREDFVRFVHRFPEVYQAVIQQLNSQYAHACEQLRTVGLSTTANEKLARLLLHWSSEEKQTSDGAHIKMPLTHEQIAECVGATRETVTRTLSDFKSRHLVMLKGTTVMIPNRAALQAISGD
jgi:CRP/FNR family transcriptional regulator, cyclic AMP receptor protein